jgi:hypothetical protein
MAYTFSDLHVGLQPIAVTSTVQQHIIGMRVHAYDPTYGEGEFIYLKGLAATAVGETVIYDTYANTTKRAVASDRGPVAVAMSANVASQFGWYQIAGSAIVKSNAVVSGASVYVTATAGTVDDAVVAGDKIDGMRFKTADGTPSAGFVTAQLARPSLNGNG